MQHGISEAEWLACLDGAVDARVARHLAECPECGELHRELVAWRRILVEEGERMRHAAPLSAAGLEQLLARTLGRIADADSSGSYDRRRWTASEALLLLRSLIEPFCGAGTAAATMDLASRRATGEAEPELTASSWPVFVRNLSEALSSVCGLAAGRLVDLAGNCVAIKES